MGDKRSLYQFWDLVVYAGQFWRVMGNSPDGLYLRSPGWEHSWGWWGWGSIQTAKAGHPEPDSGGQF